ncbi:Bystin domain-containing protein [Rozella allomycis CSF55]|uniref:Bystin domain-containing protein n=1 Tax=Rozella allomycis (strain CSF55) TaxID=988480 RepID=A0A075ATU6_ROZAC|nr:Bystin domain-containing protein [Rozella allomycis CSF55]|eukprot:EPZ33678.1 Bystin domain-containing protein [Rozella allomycis CSF55]
MKIRKSSSKRLPPLQAQLERDTYVTMKNKTKNQESDSDLEENVIDAVTSKRIMKAVKKQQEEIFDEENKSSKDKMEMPAVFESTMAVDSDNEVDDEWSDYEDENANTIDPQEEQIFNQFVSGIQADQLVDRINLPQTEAAKNSNLHPKIVQVYSKVGLLLSRYKSGKLPKAFKVIPSLKNWESVLALTNPMEWTPHAVYEATRIFASNLNARMSQVFYFNILLEHVRINIKETSKLNVHLYNALKKSVYKPAAFFKGIILPLVEDQCTLREATIVGSVITKVSIPVLHSSAALLKLAEMDYSPACSIFIKCLLDKKYAMPFQVIDSLVYHFARFANDSRELPVLWHQAFLVFCQRYKDDLTDEQKEVLLSLAGKKEHYLISKEIKRELTQSATSRMQQ